MSCITSIAVIQPSRGVSFQAGTPAGTVDFNLRAETVPTEARREVSASGLGADTCPGTDARRTQSPQRPPRERDAVARPLQRRRLQTAPFPETNDEDDPRRPSLFLPSPGLHDDPLA